MTAKIVEGPGYVPTGDGKIMLLGEFSRTVPVECNVCGDERTFRLCSDEILPDNICDNLLDDHLRGLGWMIGGNDTCPDCSRP